MRYIIPKYRKVKVWGMVIRLLQNVMMDIPVERRGLNY